MSYHSLCTEIYKVVWDTALTLIAGNIIVSFIRSMCGRGVDLSIPLLMLRQGRKAVKQAIRITHLEHGSGARRKTIPRKFCAIVSLIYSNPVG